MKTRLYVSYFVLIFGLATAFLSNAMDDVREISAETWWHIFRSNNVEDTKAKVCSKLMPKFIRTHPESVDQLSTLKNKPEPMKFAVLNAVYDELMAAAKKDEL